jgi:hypothetical protein
MLPAGTDDLTASYGGDGTFAPVASDDLWQQVGLFTTLSLSSDTALPLPGQPVTLTATVSSSSGTPTGDVTFLAGGTALATVALDGSGTATFTTSDLPSGADDLTAQ